MNADPSMRGVVAAVVLMMLSACSTPRPTAHIVDDTAIAQSRLPTPDRSLEIEGLGPCTDAPDRTLQLNSGHEINLMVHGCFGSAGRFRALADVLAFHGQQSACFSYDDRASLEDSSGELARAVEALAAAVPGVNINVIGHSQGGLVARRALIAERSDRLAAQASVRLVTVSAPFAGIRSARFCAYPLLRIATLGLNDLACHAISGPKWFEITYASGFTHRPGTLVENVSEHLKVVTDERDSCRRRTENRSCVESDYVFSLGEQYHAPVDAHRDVVNVELRAGHVEIVGNHETVPTALIETLQKHGVIAPTPPEHRSALRVLLTRLYLD